MTYDPASYDEESYEVHREFYPREHEDAQPAAEVHAAPIMYFANPVRAAIPVMEQGGNLGFINTPRQGNKLPEHTWWMADNGAFAKGYPGDEALLRWLASFSDEQRERALFATAPDVVGDAAATAKRSAPMLAPIRELGFPVAYVLQDGQEDVEVPWDAIDAVFVGGSTGFKLGPVAARLVREAKERGKWVHMGRVNSLKRLRYAQGIGADSADGTYLTFGPEVNLPRLLGWLDAVNQGSVALAA